jgi:hypothetical protein
MGDDKDRRSYQAGNKFTRNFTWADIGRYKPGKRVLWKDGKEWHPGTVTASVRLDATGAQYVTVVNTGRATRNVGAGETTRVYPGGIKKA